MIFCSTLFIKDGFFHFYIYFSWLLYFTYFSYIRFYRFSADFLGITFYYLDPVSAELGLSEQPTNKSARYTVIVAITVTSFRRVGKMNQIL